MLLFGCFSELMFLCNFQDFLSNSNLAFLCWPNLLTWNRNFSWQPPLGCVEMELGTHSIVSGWSWTFKALWGSRVQSSSPNPSNFSTNAQEPSLRWCESRRQRSEEEEGGLAKAVGDHGPPRPAASLPWLRASGHRLVINNPFPAKWYKHREGEPRDSQAQLQSPRAGEVTLPRSPKPVFQNTSPAAAFWGSEYPDLRVLPLKESCHLPALQFNIFTTSQGLS